MWGQICPEVNKLVEERLNKILADIPSLFPVTKEGKRIFSIEYNNLTTAVGPWVSPDLLVTLLLIHLWMSLFHKNGFSDFLDVSANAIFDFNGKKCVAVIQKTYPGLSAGYSIHCFRRSRHEHALRLGFSRRAGLSAPSLPRIQTNPILDHQQNEENCTVFENKVQSVRRESIARKCTCFNYYWNRAESNMLWLFAEFHKWKNNLSAAQQTMSFFPSVSAPFSRNLPQNILTEP